MNRSTVAVVALLTIASTVVPGVAAGVGTGPQGTATAESVDASGPDLVTLTIQLRTPDGKAIGGAKVNVTYDGGSNTTRSFSNGNALVDVPKGVDATIRVTHPDYIINRPVTVQDITKSQDVPITMYPRGVAIVEVRDSTGKIKNAQVSFTKQGRDAVAVDGYTGGNGLYQTPPIEAGQYTVTVIKRGYERTQTTMDVGTSESGSGAVVTLTEKSVDVSITVKDDHFKTPQPIEGARVRILYQGQELLSGQTGDSGKRTLPVGVNGQYTITVTKPGYGTASQTFYLGEEPRSFSFTISRNRSLSVEIVSGDRVIVGETSLIRVTNAYGERVEGAVVSRNGTTVGRTGESGELRVEIPSTGTFEVVATKDGVSSNSVTIQGFEPASPTMTATETVTETATETATETPTETQGGPLPGFTPFLALVGVLTALAVLRWRRR